MPGEGLGTAITAPRVAGRECGDCRWGVRKGRRTEANVAPAEYACENCGRPVCVSHLAYERGGDWWVCIRCLDRFFRVAERRRG